MAHLKRTIYLLLGAEFGLVHNYEMISVTDRIHEWVSGYGCWEEGRADEGMRPSWILPQQRDPSNHRSSRLWEGCSHGLVNV